MSQPGNGKRSTRQRRKQNKVASHTAQLSSEDETMPRPLDVNRKATTTSLESIHIPPRTPRSARVNGNDDDVELSLLFDEQRRAANVGVAEHLDTGGEKVPKRSGPSKDRAAMVLLVVLCALSLRFLASVPGQYAHHPPMHVQISYKESL
jgi:hypothetical protein